MNTPKTKEEIVEMYKKEVEIEGCQAKHDGETCLHCNISPCPHCRFWGGVERTEKKFMISEDEFRQALTLHEQAVQERVVEVLEGLRRDCPHDSHNHCMEEKCYIHEENGYNQALNNAITKIKEQI